MPQKPTQNTLAALLGSAAVALALSWSTPALAQQSATTFESVVEAKQYADANGLILVMGNQSAFVFMTPAEFDQAKAAARKVKLEANYIRLFGFVVPSDKKILVKPPSSGGGGSDTNDGGGGGGDEDTGK